MRGRNQQFAAKSPLAKLLQSLLLSELHRQMSWSIGQCRITHGPRGVGSFGSPKKGSRVPLNTKFHSNPINFLWTDVHTDGRTDIEADFIRSTRRSRHKNWQSFDKFKYLNTLCYFCHICIQTLSQLFRFKYVSEKCFSQLFHKTQIIYHVIPFQTRQK